MNENSTAELLVHFLQFLNLLLQLLSLFLLFPQLQLQTGHLTDLALLAPLRYRLLVPSHLLLSSRFIREYMLCFDGLGFVGVLIELDLLLLLLFLLFEVLRL